MNTKIESYKKLTFQNQIQQKIYDYLLNNPDQTSIEIAKSLGIRHTTILGRLNELENDFVLETVKLKRNLNTGRENKCYRVDTDIDSVIDEINLRIECINEILMMLKRDKVINNLSFITKAVINENISKNEKKLKRFKSLLKRYENANN